MGTILAFAIDSDSRLCDVAAVVIICLMDK